MTKGLNNMLGIETKLLIAFHLQTDGQTKRINQKLEQYLRFFIDHRQKDWLKQLALVEFVINNKAYLTTKVSPFMENYGRELRIGMDLRRKEKIEKAIKFAKRIRKVQKEAGVALAKAQEEIKRQADRGKKEAEVQKIENKIILSTKDLVFKERLVKKLVDQYISPYIIDEVISTSAVKL